MLESKPKTPVKAATCTQEVEGTLVILINWVILATPIAVLSLVAKALGDQDNLKDSFSNVGFLILATMVANVMHVLVVHFGLLSLVLRQNPLKFLRSAPTGR